MSFSRYVPGAETIDKSRELEAARRGAEEGSRLGLEKGEPKGHGGGGAAGASFEIDLPVLNLNKRQLVDDKALVSRNSRPFSCRASSPPPAGNLSSGELVCS